MWLIVGLGNPGRAYVKTRHNLGFMVVDAISSAYSISVKNKSENFISGKGCIGDKEVILAKPSTFMNRSGIAVRDAIRKYNDIDGIIVIHDDLDMDIGILKIKKDGSSGGHKGVESIINVIGTKNFLRIKIGVGRSSRIPPEEYVLSPFDKQEKPLIKDAIERAVDAVAIILDKGVAHAQNKFNLNLPVNFNRVT